MFSGHRNLILLFWTAAAAASAGCQSVPTEQIPANADPTAEIDALTKARDAARGQSVDALSPKSWDEVNAQIEEAKHERDEGKDSKVILRHVALGKAALKKANDSAQIVRSTIPTVLEARRLALEASAPKATKEEFDAVERDFKKATQEVEDGDLGLAERTRDDLQHRYADVELKAIKINALGESRKSLEQARREGADKWAPHSLAQAEKEVGQADAFIDANPHDKAGIQARAQAATGAAGHLLAVTRQAKVTQKTDSEALVLQREEETNRLTSEKTAAERMAADSSAQLSGTQGTLERAQTENAQLASQQDFNKKFDAAQARFAPGEATVLRQGNNMLVRLKGLEFASGKAAIPPKNFGLLGKVLEVAKDFNPTKVTVEGHTDASGTRAKNETLSEERAQAVVEYLSANGIERSKLTAQGYGDQKPIASNKTVDGRAQNRRVDIILESPAGNVAH